MNCVNCLQENNAAFDGKVNDFQGRRPLVVFLLNTVLNSKDICKNFCYCPKIIGKCLACPFKIYYLNSEYDIYENCFDCRFLHFFHSQMRENLKKLTIIENHIVCKLLNKQYHYQHRDWFTGHRYEYTVLECLEKYGDHNINKIVKNKCRVLIDRL